MTNPDSDTANYALYHITRWHEDTEGIRGSTFFEIFWSLCFVSTTEQLDRLSLAYPDYVAAFKLARSPDGIDILRQLAHPVQT